MGDRIRERRQAQGRTLAQLAYALGVAQGTVWRWEHGALPDPGGLVKLSDQLGVGVRWLLVGEDEPVRHDD